MPVERLGITQRVSQPASAYDHYTRTVAALERTEQLGRARHPGQDVDYVVVDDSRSNQDRVRLVDEATTYDPTFYRERLVRAAASVLAPVGWREAQIASYLAEHTDVSLARFV